MQSCSQYSVIKYQYKYQYLSLKYQYQYPCLKYKYQYFSSKYQYTSTWKWYLSTDQVPVQVPTTTTLRLCSAAGK